jgi:predicted MFS family arabinose efflux permease
MENAGETGERGGVEGGMTTGAKLGLLGSLYLSQGLPFGFFTQALPVLLRREGASLEMVGLANLLALPWALKFLWAPLLDRWPRRRAVIVTMQVGSAAALGVVALRPPAGSLTPLLVAVVLVNALAATQDIATDALAVTLLSERERGLGNGVQVAGYRLGMILGGGLVVSLLGYLGWSASFGAMAAALLVATIPIACHREAPRPSVGREESGEGSARGAGVGWWLRDRQARGWLGLLVAYKAGEALAVAMLRPMLVDAGVGLESIGLMLGTVGFGAGLVGALVGGALLPRLGERVALGSFGLLQSASVGLYALAAGSAGVLAAGPVGLGVLCGLGAVEHLASGMATAALFAAMMGRCRPGHEATDYTVQASAVVVATGLMAAVSGAIAHRVGYERHFVLAAVLSALGALLAAARRSAIASPS